MKIFSFFSGSGFLDLGFELSGYSIDLVNEFSPAFIGAYKYSREKMGLEKPVHGYSNIDINEYLGIRSLRHTTSKEVVFLLFFNNFLSGGDVGIAPYDFSLRGSIYGKNVGRADFRRCQFHCG